MIADENARPHIRVVLLCGGGPVRAWWLDELEAILPIAIHVPSDVGPSALGGDTDIEASLIAGTHVRAKGLLERAKNGALIVPVDQLTSPLVSALANIDGSSTEPMLVLTSESGECPKVLADCIDVTVDLRQVSWTVATDREPFTQPRWNPVGSHKPFTVPVGSLRIEDQLLAALDQASGRLVGTTGLVPSIRALSLAKLLAAREGAPSVEPTHILSALRLRHGYVHADGPEQPTPPTPEPNTADTVEEPEGCDPSEAVSENDVSEGTDDAHPPPLDAVLEAIATAFPFALNDVDQTRPVGRSAEGSGRSHDGDARGRPVGIVSRAPYRGARIDVPATLRAAVPWQRLRPSRSGFAVAVRASDFRYVRRKAQAGTTIIFAVDASGSAAIERLAEAKGAVEYLLNEAYVRRDEVALIAFRHGTAELSLPPTRGLAAAKRTLGHMPAGGGTPLAAGIMAAGRLADRVSRGGRSSLVVFLTDGRGNVALDGRTGRTASADDEHRMARAFAATGTRALVVDTAIRPGRHARALAELLRARHLVLPRADGASIARCVAEDIS